MRSIVGRDIGTTKFVILKAGPHDLTGLLELYRHLYHVAAASEPAHAADQWSRLLASDCARVLVVEDQQISALVGTCVVAIIPSLAHGCRPWAVIEHVVTHPDYRRKGIGSSLLRAALAQADGENCYKVMLATGSKNPATLRFYENAGFRRSSKTLFEIRRVCPPDAKKALGTLA